LPNSRADLFGKYCGQLVGIPDGVAGRVIPMEFHMLRNGFSFGLEME